MSNSPLVVVGPDGRRPFMRGILVQSLVSRGVPFDVALETANRIRSEVAGSDEVAVGELSDRVAELLSDFDLDALPVARPEPPRVVADDGSSNPFSKGILAVSLQGAGLDPSDAYDVARAIEGHLLRDGRGRIDRTELRQRVAEAIETDHGKAAATRYRVWRQARESDRPTFILLGGSSGVGKTSIAVEVARRLEIPRVIGTDSIRQIMRLMFSESLMPEIHCSTFDAHSVLRGLEGDGDAVIAGFREQAQKIAVGAQALLDRALAENTSLLIEGANLLPGLLELDRYRDHANVIFLVIAGLEPEAYQARFARRGDKASERPAHRYISYFDEILSIQDHILSEADHLGLPIIDNVHLDDAVVSVIRSVIATLKKSMSKEVEGS